MISLFASIGSAGIAIVLALFGLSLTIVAFVVVFGLLGKLLGV